MPKVSIQKIEVIKPNILSSAIDGKRNLLDLKMNVDDKVVSVGIDLKDEGDYRDRAVYYWSKMYA